MQTNDVPLCLKRAREEILLALDSPTAEDEGGHRKRAACYARQAIRTIRDDPMREYDWSMLRSRH